MWELGIGIYKLCLTNATDPLRSSGLRVFNTFLSFWFPSRLSLLEWYNGICCNLCWQWQTTLMNWLPLWTASRICRHYAVTERHSFTNLLPCKVVSVLNDWMQLRNRFKFPVEFWIWVTGIWVTGNWSFEYMLIWIIKAIKTVIAGCFHC